MKIFILKIVEINKIFFTSIINCGGQRKILYEHITHGYQRNILYNVKITKRTIIENGCYQNIA